MTFSVHLVVVILLSVVRDGLTLRCYECSDTFKTLWKPADCQTNISAIPTRSCNDEQRYCYVKRVTVKDIVSEIVRDCTDECRYGCEANSFGITKITCVSCCDQDNCNTGNEGHTQASDLLTLLVITCVNNFLSL